MRDEGHAVENHGYYHRKLTFRSPSYVSDDIGGGGDAITRPTCVMPTLFRAPHGQRNPWVTRIARTQGQRTVGWTLGVCDTDRALRERGFSFEQLG